MKTRPRSYWQVGALAAVLGAFAVASASADSPLAWSPPAAIDGSTALLALSCVPATGACAAGDADGNIVATTNIASGSWSPTSPDPGNGIYSMSCVAGLCAAGDNDGRILTASGPGASWNVWQAETGAYVIGGVSCVSSAFCVAVDSDGNVLTSTSPASASWSSAAVDPDNALLAVWCESTTSCVAVDDNGEVTTSANPTGGVGAWSSPTPVAPVGDSIDTIDCPSSTLCVAGDEMGDVITSTDGGTSWSAPVQIEPQSDSISGVSCSSASDCVAVDNDGNVLTSANPAGGANAWNVTAVAGNDQFNAVSCATVSLCAIVDQFGGELTGAPAVAPAGGTSAGGGSGGGTAAGPGRYTLSVAVTGAGRGTVSFTALGLDCSSSCSAAGAPGSYAGTALAAAGSRFAGWGGACTGTGACSVSLAANTSVSAEFVAVPKSPAIGKPRITGTTAVLKLTEPHGIRTMQCALVRAASGKHAGKPRPVYARCSASVTYRHLRKGGYVFYARAVAAGGVDSAAVTRAFTVR